MWKTFKNLSRSCQNMHATQLRGTAAAGAAASPFSLFFFSSAFCLFVCMLACLLYIHEKAISKFHWSGFLLYGLDPPAATTTKSTSLASDIACRGRLLLLPRRLRLFGCNNANNRKKQQQQPQQMLPLLLGQKLRLATFFIYK